MINLTFELLTVGAETPVIRCLLCGAVSANRNDRLQGYCGRCHLFHDAAGFARQLHTEGATHECGEWQTGVGTCAVCGPLVARHVQL